MPSNDFNTSPGLSYSSVNSTIFDSIRNQERDLKTTLAGLRAKGDGNVTPADLLQMQQQIQQWAMMVDLQSTITKQISDSLKGVIQKSG